ncbi:hypothetical protein MMC07_006652 [Pseudocyphellaria aurata]|nr:hypothetical protein [Pseudocyphellaria aurata]
MECAGRGLAFWSYQSTQEIVYQEYLAKTLTDKYGNLNVQVDKIINDANAELEILHQKLAVMQIDQDKLKTDNTNLVVAFREKSRKHQQTQELYDRLKRKEMTAATQSAAIDSVDEVLGSISGRSCQDPNQPSLSRQYQASSRPPGHSHSPVEVHGQQQVYGHGRSGSNGSQGGKGLMPPPPNPTNKPGNRGFEFGHGLSHNLPTPAQYRPQIGSVQQSGGQSHAGNYMNAGRISATRLQQTPSQRQPLATVGNSSLNRSGLALRQPYALLTPRIMVKTVVEAELFTLRTLSDNLSRYTTMVELITNRYLHSTFSLLPGSRFALVRRMLSFCLRQ